MISQNEDVEEHHQERNEEHQVEPFINSTFFSICLNCSLSLFLFLLLFLLCLFLSSFFFNYFFNSPLEHCEIEFSFVIHIFCLLCLHKVNSSSNLLRINTSKFIVLFLKLNCKNIFNFAVDS